MQSTITSLGASPVAGCTFDFSAVLESVSTMAPVARLVENVGVGAYLGAAHLISDPTILTAAASIVTVEARHQTILNVLSDATAIPNPFDLPLLPQEVLAIAGSFISGCDVGIVGKSQTSGNSFSRADSISLRPPAFDCDEHRDHRGRRVTDVQLRRQQLDRPIRESINLFSTGSAA